MNISEIFCSINGESCFSGLRTVFIRTYGCNLMCSYCDSTYSVCGGSYSDMSIADIVEQVENYNCKRVTLTGGEPLLQEGALDLIKDLVSRGYTVEIETNGAVNLAELTSYRKGDTHIVITMDWKCPSSKMRSKMIDENLIYLSSWDVVKCVVGSKEDLDEMRRISDKSVTPYAQVYVSPVFGEIDLVDIANYIVDNQLNDVRFQLQIHKLIWDPDKRGV